MRRSALVQLLRSVGREVERDQLTLVAAGVAFFGFLAMFPLFAALVAIYGLVFDPTEVERQMNQLHGVMPGEAHTLISEQLARLADEAPSSLSIGVVIALVVALWSASKGSSGIIKAINIAFDAEETRGFVKLNVVSLLLTLGSVVFVMLAVALAAGIPAVLRWVGLDTGGHGWIAFMRWPLLMLVVLVAVSAVYAFAPDRAGRPRRRLVTAGSMLASVGLVVASAFFSLYVSRFGDYNEVYGSLGAVAVFLLWLYITALVVLLGAELDAELERAGTGSGTGTGTGSVGALRAPTDTDARSSSGSTPVDTSAGRPASGRDRSAVGGSAARARPANRYG